MSRPLLWPSTVCLSLLLTAAALPGCAWLDSLKGDGFPQWSETMGGGVRGKDGDAKPSGFFTDTRSEQIERNLGGGF